MEKKLKDKIRLFRILHGVNQLWMDGDDKLFVNQPKDFTGK